MNQIRKKALDHKGKYLPAFKQGSGYHRTVYSFFHSKWDLSASCNELSALGLSVIPYPQEVVSGGPDFIFNGKLSIVLDKKTSAADRFAADELAKDLKKRWNIDATVSDAKGRATRLYSHIPAAPEIL